jgi:uncharacterized membrane protein YraQ (UPF0718 family)
MAGTNFPKVWAYMLAGVLAAGLLAATVFAPGAAAQDPGCKGEIVLAARPRRQRHGRR